MNGLLIIANVFWFTGFTISIFIIIISLYIKFIYKKIFKAFEPVFLCGGLLMGMSLIQCSLYGMNIKYFLLLFFEKNIYFSCLVCIILIIIFVVWLENRRYNK